MFGLPLVHWLVIVSALLSITGGTLYVRNTIAGRTKPNRVSWTMWAISPLVSTAAALSAGADPWATVRVFIGGVIPLVVLMASFVNPKSYWKVTMFDAACGTLSVLALVLWGYADSPRSAVMLAAIGNGCAAVPTVVKAWRFPETETGANFLASFIGVTIILPAIPVWNIENAAFQLSLLGVNALVLFAIYRKRLGFGA